MPDSLDLELPEGEPELDGHSSGGAAIDLPDEVAAPAAPPEGGLESVLTASLQRGQLELQLTGSQRTATDLFVWADTHAFLLKDPEAASAVLRFIRATAELWEDDLFLRAGEPPAAAGEGVAHSLARSRRLWPEGHVLFTHKKLVPAQKDAQYNELLKRLTGALDLSDGDRKCVQDAGHIHALLRFRQSDPGAGGSKSTISNYGKLLSALHEEPMLLRLLRSMYTRTGAAEGPGALGQGAAALTLVDLFCDRFHPEHALHRPLVQGLETGLAALAEGLVPRSVLDVFLSLLEEDLPAREADDHKNRVLIYTDWLDHIFPLEARLRQEGFQTFITDSLEACPQINRRKHPNIVILRLRAQPSIVIKAIHYLLSHGVTLTETPTFLLVDSQHIDRLTSLLALGIEDILDLQGRLDPVILKVKKVRSRQIGSARAQLAQAATGAGTSGNLADMNLIDLMQALGPSQRTAKVTLHSAEAGSVALSLYLNKGCIAFAELGELKGDPAIHRAMAWHQGSWLVEQVTEAELPAPNTSLSNEAILIEGCRLLDESARGTENAPA